MHNNGTKDWQQLVNAWPQQAGGRRTCHNTHCTVGHLFKFVHDPLFKIKLAFDIMHRDQISEQKPPKVLQRKEHKTLHSVCRAIPKYNVLAHGDILNGMGLGRFWPLLILLSQPQWMALYRVAQNRHIAAHISTFVGSQKLDKADRTPSWPSLRIVEFII